MRRRDFLRQITAGWIGLLAGANGLFASTSSHPVREAIGAKRCLRFTYAGHIRHVEPHALGVTPGGHRAIVAWQFAGSSRREPVAGWRTFLLSEMHAIEMTVRPFKVRVDYARSRLPLREIEVDVRPEEPAAP